jgi:Iodothyronine deiodinase
VIYIREAHPTDGWQVPANVREKILLADPKTLAERRKVAQEFAAQFKVSLPILVDTLDDLVEKAYAAWPDRVYVIAADGKIAYKGAIGPAGFKVGEVPPVLDTLLGVADTLADAPSPLAPLPKAGGGVP